MAMFWFTVLFMNLCCVHCVVAHLDGVRHEDKESDTNSSASEVMPPPVQQDHAEVGSLGHEIVKKDNTMDTNDTVSGTAAPLSVEKLDAQLQDLRKFAKKATMRDVDFETYGQLVEFMTSGLQSFEQLEQLAARMYCLNGENLPRDCQDIYNGGQTTSGVYRVYPYGTSPFDVYCNQETDGGGWTVIQKRYDGSEDFYRGWEDYKQGFGNVSGEFWLGNDKINRMTDCKVYKLKIVLNDGNEIAFADYASFSVGPESEKYKLQVSGYSGNAGDSLTNHNGYKFSTKDQDNDIWAGQCAQTYTGAWWYAACYNCNLNGKYNAETSSWQGIVWHPWKEFKSLTAAYMMIKKN